MQTKKPEVERAILDAARELFFEHGFEGVSMRAVARAVDMTPGNIYVYFQGKDDLYFSVFTETNTRRLERVTAAFQQETTAPAKLRRYAHEYFAWSAEHPRELRLELHYMHHGMGEKRLSPNLRQHYAEILKPYHYAFLAIFEEGLEKGEMQFEQTPQQVVTWFTYTLRTMLNETLVLCYHDEQFYNGWVEFFIDAITPSS